MTVYIVGLEYTATPGFWLADEARFHRTQLGYPIHCMYPGTNIDFIVQFRLPKLNLNLVRVAVYMY